MSSLILLLPCVAAIHLISKEEDVGQHDLVMFHVPMNFGNAIAAAAALGSASGISYHQVADAARVGWPVVRKMSQQNAEFWGPINPALQEPSQISHCSMYYTPQKQWPPELAEHYFGNKTVFGILRDPYERLMAMYRGFYGGGEVQQGENFVSDGRVCDISKFVKDLFRTPFAQWSSDTKCQLQPQAWFFEGRYGIKIPIDIRAFPASANRLFAEHGYANIHLGLNDLMHVSGCDETWAGNMDDEAKQLIRNFYKADFDLLCRHFGYCTEGENVCLTHVPGMCPSRLFSWNHTSLQYVRK